MGRSFNLFTAAFMYMLYSNCLNIVQSFIAQGKLGFWPGSSLPHSLARRSSSCCCSATRLRCSRGCAAARTALRA